MSRPSYVKLEHLLFLNELRESGVTNMFGAAPYISKAFGIDENKSIQILSYWMKTFGNEDI
ncbi:MAG: hypothetical protein ACOC2U_05255 [bacterium]